MVIILQKCKIQSRNSSESPAIHIHSPTIQLERPRVGNVKWLKMQIVYGLFKTIGIDVDILPLQIF